MATNEQIEFLGRHLPYERWMLDHTYSRLFQVNDQADWNAFLESFAVHSRNLIAFLLNDDDNRNFKSENFADNFVASNVRQIRSTRTKFEEQVLHLSKHRTSDTSNKVTIDRTIKIYKWIDQEFQCFMAKLKEEYKNYYESRSIKVEGSVPAATNETQATSSIIDATTTSLSTSIVSRAP